MYTSVTIFEILLQFFRVSSKNKSCRHLYERIIKLENKYEYTNNPIQIDTKLYSTNSK